MKTLLATSFLAVSMIFIACGNNNSSSNESSAKNADSSSQATNTDKAADNTDTKMAGTTSDVVTHYMHLKNALANDNGNDAAAAAKELGSAFEKINITSLSSGEKKVYDDVKDDIKEHAEHIGENSGKIEHQREHFEMLSKDIYDLVKTSTPAQTLYKDFCPMANEGKGAIWLSETKEVKNNPYQGKKMSTCGKMQEEIK